MSTLQKFLAAALLVLLAAASYGWWYTSQRAATVTRPGAALPQIDEATGISEGTFALAQRLALMADGPEEQRLAAAAERLADHELDLAFTGALRRLEAHPPVLSPDAQAIQERLDRSQKSVDADQAKVKQLTAAVAQASEPQKSHLQDELDLASSQLELDKDEVDEANQDLLQAGGNQHQRVQVMMQEHAAAQAHPLAAAASAAPQTGTFVGGLVRNVERWLTLRRKQEWLVYARSQAAAGAARLSADHQTLAVRLDTVKAQTPELARHAQDLTQTRPGTVPVPAAGAAAAKASSPAATAAAQSDSASLLATTRRIAADQQRLTLLDQRISALQQLAGVYGNWNALAGAKTLGLLHEILSDVAVVVAIVLVLLFIDRWLERLLERTRLDRRQVGTLRSVTRVALQVLGLLIILLIVIGMPSQLGTMIGLAGAGLTVALKDFIVAFIGWLVLMGRNGVRLGDWVEINGVSGEVVELGMFHTVLLETGNWTDSSQPTGRRVTFTNSFAIEGHYFNFSTSGQWLWDQLLVLVPFDRDPNLIAEAIQKEVLAATAESAAQAEQEWRRTPGARRGSVFSAAPGVTVKPAVGGVEIAVRYITRASERFQLRSRLFQRAVQLLAKAGRERGSDAQV